MKEIFLEKLRRENGDVQKSLENKGRNASTTTRKKNQKFFHTPLARNSEM